MSLNQGPQWVLSDSDGYEGPIWTRRLRRPHHPLYLTATVKKAMSLIRVSAGAGPYKYRCSSVAFTLYTLKPNPGCAYGNASLHIMPSIEHTATFQPKTVHTATFQPKMMCRETSLHIMPSIEFSAESRVAGAGLWECHSLIPGSGGRNSGSGIDKFPTPRDFRPPEKRVNPGLTRLTSFVVRSGGACSVYLGGF